MGTRYSNPGPLSRVGIRVNEQIQEEKRATLIQVLVVALSQDRVSKHAAILNNFLQRAPPPHNEAYSFQARHLAVNVCTSC